MPNPPNDKDLTSSSNDESQPSHSSRLRGPISRGPVKKVPGLEEAAQDTRLNPKVPPIEEEKKSTAKNESQPNNPSRLRGPINRGPIRKVPGIEDAPLLKNPILDPVPERLLARAMNSQHFPGANPNVKKANPDQVVIPSDEGNYVSEPSKVRDRYAFAIPLQQDNQIEMNKSVLNKKRLYAGHFEFDNNGRLKLPAGDIYEEKESHLAPSLFNHSFEVMNRYEHPLIEKVQEREQALPRLNAALKNYNGLCEILCNYFVINDVLNEKNEFYKNKFKGMEKTSNINVLENEIAKLHILKQVSFYQIFKAAVFNVIPNNYLKRDEQKKLANLDDKKLESKETKDAMGLAIDRIKPGDYAKFFVFTKKGLAFGGHAMLIKKTDDNKLMFYDPNDEPKKFNNKNDLIDHLKDRFKLYQKEYGLNNICFMDVQKMLPKAKLDEKVEQVARPSKP